MNRLEFMKKHLIRANILIIGKKIPGDMDRKMDIGRKLAELAPTVGELS